jgi:hypothetical protein
MHQVTRDLRTIDRPAQKRERDGAIVAAFLGEA